MRAVVGYESMYGNTRRIAESIADGFGAAACVVMPAADLDQQSLRGCTLLIVGGPTHVFGLSRPASRRSAVAAAAKPGSTMIVEPHAEAPGLREMLSSIDGTGCSAVAFDTRVRTWFSGRASMRIRHLLHQAGFSPVLEPVSFFVTKANELEPNECDRALEWGRQLRQRNG